MELAIETVGLSKSYGNLQVLSGLNLKIPRGRLHALIGSNGAGKTTTLKILSGIIKPTSGSARILGFDMDAQPMKVKERVGYIPETPTLYKSLKVKEFLNFVGIVYSVPIKTLNDNIGKYSDLFGVQVLKNKYLGSLSKGETQKVLITSLWIREPTVFLLDEPFYSLDPKSAIVFKEALKEKCRDGATVLFATHLVEMAEKICDSYTIIDKGITKVEGSIEDIKDQWGFQISLEELFLKVVES